MLWLKIIWFFGWQALLAMVLVGWQRKILRRARSGEDLPSPRAFHVFVQLYFCLPWLLAGWIALQASRRSGFSGAGASDFPFVFGAIIVPQLLLHLALYGQLSRLGLGVREITPTRRDVQLVWIGILQYALLSAMVSFVILVMGFQVPRAVMGVGFGVFLLAVVGLHRARTTLTRARPSRAVEMEDSPLRSEILAVAAAFGWQPQTVLVRPLKRTSEGGELSPTEMLLTLQLWWQRFDPRQPVIPVELLQQVDPDGVTAAVAVRYARLVDPFPGGLHRLRSSRPGGLLLVGAALLLIAFMALAVGAALGLDQNALFILVCLFSRSCIGPHSPCGTGMRLFAALEHGAMETHPVSGPRRTLSPPWPFTIASPAALIARTC